MKRLLLIPVLLLTLLVGNPACSTGFQKGLDAYQRGDYETALRELEPLAEQGNPDAQYNLGWMYYQGEGTAQDYVYAHMWLNICASEGDKNAVKNQERVAMKMTPLQLTNARRLASECIKKKVIIYFTNPNPSEIIYVSRKGYGKLRLSQDSTTFFG